MAHLETRTHKGYTGTMNRNYHLSLIGPLLAALIFGAVFS